MTTYPPELDSCRQLLLSLMAPEHLVVHSRLVAQAATILAGLCRADQALSAAAAWLHDVGKAPLAADATARLTGQPAAKLASLDHGQLGAELLRSWGPSYASCADAVAQHPLSSVLRGRGPSEPVEQIVFIADKMVGTEWLGFAGRIADLSYRYGHIFDVRLCVPGASKVLMSLARSAALGPRELECLVATGMRT